MGWNDGVVGQSVVLNIEPVPAADALGIWGKMDIRQTGQLGPSHGGFGEDK